MIKRSAPPVAQNDLDTCGHPVAMCVAQLNGTVRGLANLQFKSRAHSQHVNHIAYWFVSQGRRAHTGGRMALFLEIMITVITHLML
jgi:hypothetical protein